MLREKSGRYFPTPNEIPYGFKNTWIIDVEAINITDFTFIASEVLSILRNNYPTTEAQMREMYDYGRDYASLRSESTGSLLVAINEYDVETGLYRFVQIAQQTTNLEGILSLRGEGDIVDNTDPNNPIVRHDSTKLDVTQYDSDQQLLANRITIDETNISNNANAISQLQSGKLSGVTFNGVPADVTNNVADIVADVVYNDTFEAGLSEKVDKTVAGAGQTIVQAADISIDPDTRLLTMAKTLLSLETGVKTSASDAIDLPAVLGIDDLESIDKQLFYFTPTNINANYNNPVTVQLSALYGIAADGTQYVPTTTANIKTIYAVSVDYSGIGAIRRSYIAAIGGVQSSTATTLVVAFTNVVQYSLYNKYNSYRAGNIVLDRDTHAFFEVLQTVPLPTAESTIIPITNTLYYMPVTDYTMMSPDTVWANLQPTENAGEAVSVEQMRFALLQLASGYTDFVRFRGNVIPSAILTSADWNTYVSLWVTDGYEFTSLDSLMQYLANFYVASRYKLSNLGIVSTRYEAGGITITKEFDSTKIASLLVDVFQPVLDNVENHVVVFDADGKVSSSGKTIADFATSAQGAKADSAVQSVSIAPGSSNGTISVSVDGTSEDVTVTGLDTAAYQPTTAFATAAQGEKADTSIQTVSLSPGTNNGTIAITANGVTQSPVQVTGLDTAAYQPTSAFASSAQGAKADSAVQSVQITPGTANGTIQYGVNNGTTAPVQVSGLDSAAYQPVSAFASSAQGTLADTALQPSDVVDNLTSTNTQVPLSANQGRIIDERLQSIGGYGRRIGGFQTYAERYTNTSQYAPDLQPISVGDTIIIAQDEDHTNQRALYSIAAIAGDGTISYAFIELQPDNIRDLTLNPVQSSEIASGAIDTQHIQNGAIIEADIADYAITQSKLSEQLRASITKANNSMTNSITTDGNGAFVRNVTNNADNGLRISYGNAYDQITQTGAGDFFTSISGSGTNITAVKDGIALRNVTQTGTGNFVSGINASGRDLQITKANALTALTINGTGNVIANLTTAGVATKGYAFMSALKTGTGNVLTGFTSADGVITFTSGTAYNSVNVLGQGNFVKGIAANGTTLDVTLGTAVETLPAASATTAGIVRLVDNLTSTSATRALTANQGYVLNGKIDTLDLGNVKISGAQTITGTKTFEAHPVVGAKTALPTTPSSTQYATEAQTATRIPRPAAATQNNVAVFDANRNLADSGISYESLTPDAISNSLSSTYVPQIRRVNGHELTTDVTVTRADIGAVSSVNGVTPDSSGNVNTPPIINNLTTSSPGQGSLDAYQGKVLSDAVTLAQESADAAIGSVDALTSRVVNIEPYVIPITLLSANWVSGTQTVIPASGTTISSIMSWGLRITSDLSVHEAYRSASIVLTGWDGATLTFTALDDAPTSTNIPIDIQVYRRSME